MTQLSRCWAIPPLAAEGERGPDDHRQPQILGGGQAMGHGSDLDPAGQVEPDGPAGLGELHPRLGPADGVDGGPDQLDPEPLRVPFSCRATRPG